MSRRLLLRRLNALEAVTLKPEKSPAYIALEVEDMRALPEGVNHLVDMLAPSHVVINGHRVHRQPDEEPEALCLRAARLHPCSVADGVPVIFVHKTVSEVRV